MRAHVTTITVLPEAPSRPADSWLTRLGDAMQGHRRLIQGIQWFIVLSYLILLIGPVLVPLPQGYVHLYENLALFSQFLFWGLWWPFVMISMMLMGRVWCGVFCPEGALSEWASRHGLGRPIPRWMRWYAWPFLAFALTTLYGQLISVYEYPRAALLILGGSTIFAVAVGFVYGRGTRVWCRYLCPANGVFALLSRVAPIHFRVDSGAWRRAPRRTPAVDCAPLINIRAMTGNSACHMCGRCSGHRNAVSLATRSPEQEILAMPSRDVSRWEVRLLLFGMLGMAAGAFQWTVSPWFVNLKQAVASWLINQNAFLLLQDNAPWWLLTHYPESNDVFSWLDGACILFYIAASALLIGGGMLLLLRLAGRLLEQRDLSWRLAYCLIPLAGINLFLGLSSLTVSMLRGERLDLAWVSGVRMMLLLVAVVWTGHLVWRMTGHEMQSGFGGRRAAAWGLVMSGVSLITLSWLMMFFYW